MTNNDNTKCPCGNQLDIETYPFCRPCARMEREAEIAREVATMPKVDRSGAEYLKGCVR
jgi:hypothetical protein